MDAARLRVDGVVEEPFSSSTVLLHCNALARAKQHKVARIGIVHRVVIVRLAGELHCTCGGT